MRLVCLICLVLSLAPSSFVDAQEIFIQSDGKKCGLTGTAQSDAGKAIDRLKNRFTAPTPKDMDNSVSLAAFLTPGDDVGRFDETKGAKISGFVVDVKVGGVETCNCGAKNPIDRDTHIEIGFTKDAKKTQLVIVEVTPRIRAKLKAAGKDWSTDALRKNFKGKFVEITGWLLFDVPHMNEAENTHPGGPKNWRATCWEIHPITNIEVKDPTTMPVLHPDLLAQFHAVHAQHFARDTKRKEATHARNQAARDRFHPDDLDKELPTGEPPFQEEVRSNRFLRQQTLRCRIGIFRRR